MGTNPSADQQAAHLRAAAAKIRTILGGDDPAATELDDKADQIEADAANAGGIYNTGVMTNVQNSRGGGGIVNTGVMTNVQNG